MACQHSQRIIHNPIETVMEPKKHKLCVVLGFFATLFALSSGSHFRGGTISWKPDATSKGLVHFHFRTGWELGRGGCDVKPLGGYATLLTGENKWACTSGCTPHVDVGDNAYYCTAVNAAEKWEQGEKRFSYDFKKTGPFTVGYTGRVWMSLSYGVSGDWNLETDIDLGMRSDTGNPNTSPVTSGFPAYRLPFGCAATIQLPVYDFDGDTVKCRWSSGTECGSLCATNPMLPDATLDQDKCLLTLNLKSSAGYIAKGQYAVAITVEDYPKTAISLGGTQHTTSQPLSSVPLQFVFSTEQMTSGCAAVPVFIESPPDGTTFIVPSGQTWTLTVHVRGSGGSVPKSLPVSGPRDLSVSALQADDKNRPDVRLAKFSWAPSTALDGVNILCMMAEDDAGMPSTQMCYTLLAGAPDPCASGPCQNGGTCNLRYDNYTCSCPPGAIGQHCETDVDECSSKPCQNGGVCSNSVGSFHCFCQAGFAGQNCSGHDHCASNPCKSRGKCTNTGPTFSCNCSAGFGGKDCSKDVDECASSPCQNGGLCKDIIGDYICTCPVTHSGKNCDIDVTFCSPSPCKNGGACTAHKDSYSCTCSSSYVGLNCELPKTQTCNDDESYCTCMVNGKPAKVPIPKARQDKTLERDLKAGIIGYPIGLLIGVGSCAIFHYFLRNKLCKSKKYRPHRRPGSSASSTAPLTGRTPSPVSQSSATALPSNIYRSGFHDDQIFKTADRMNPNNYMNDKKDWF